MGGLDQRARLSAQLRARVSQLAARLSNSSSPEALSFTLLVPADDSQPIVLGELSEGATVSAQARQLFDGLWEVVRARGLHELAPELWPVMLVDENGHGKGLPLNRRAGELYGLDAIAGDALICQERRTAFWVDELRGFSQEEAERLRDLLFRRVSRGRG